MVAEGRCLVKAGGNVFTGRWKTLFLLGYLSLCPAGHPGEESAGRDVILAPLGPLLPGASLATSCLLHLGHPRPVTQGPEECVSKPLPPGHLGNILPLQVILEGPKTATASMSGTGLCWAR